MQKGLFAFEISSSMNSKILSKYLENELFSIITESSPSEIMHIFLTGVFYLIWLVMWLILFSRNLYMKMPCMQFASLGIIDIIAFFIIKAFPSYLNTVSQVSMKRGLIRSGLHSINASIAIIPAYYLFTS